MAAQPARAIAALLEDIDVAFQGRSWHGTTLAGALRGLRPDMASWRPAPDRKTIQELMLHAAYWKYIVRRALIGSETPRFERAPSNWPTPSAEGSAQGLRADIAFLKSEHARLREAITAFPARRLGEAAGKSGTTYAGLIRGVTFHDLHHGGQIQLMKRLFRDLVD